MGMLSELAEMNLLAGAYEHRWAIALAAVGAYVLQKLRTYWRLRRFKGPRGTGFFGLWHTRALIGWKSHIKYRQVTDTYGARVFNRPPPFLSTCFDFADFLLLDRAPRSHWATSPHNVRSRAVDAHVRRQVEL